MPPSEAFYVQPSPDILEKAALWENAALYPRGLYYACQVTFTPNKPALLGELHIWVGNLGKGSLRIPTKVSDDSLRKMPASMKALLTNNQILFNPQGKEADYYTQLGLTGVNVGDSVNGFECSTLGSGSTPEDSNWSWNLTFYRLEPEGRFRYLEDQALDEAAKLKLRRLSAQGLAQVIERDLGWKVEPLALR